MHKHTLSYCIHSYQLGPSSHQIRKCQTGLGSPALLPVLQGFRPSPLAPPPPPPTKASEGGVIVHPAITKDPELLMVAAMIDPSWKFTMVENEFQRTVKIAEWLFRDEKIVL